MKLDDAFRELRQAWFMHILKENGPEREWETTDGENARGERNLELHKRFTNQTEAIINGANRCIAPHCKADMDRR